MKKIIKLFPIVAVIATLSACTTVNDCPYKKHYDNQPCTQCGEKNCKHKMHYNQKKTNKVYSKMYTRNNHGEASEIGYVKFYDIDQGVKMVVNVDHLRPNVDYTTIIAQCKDAKCTNPDTCCRETVMSMQMPLVRNNKTDSTLQKSFIINNVTTDQLHGATIFFERDNGYRAAWGFVD